MAKPGSRGAKALNAKAVDLAARRMTDEQAQEVQEMLELREGKRCNGCGRRIAMGMRFTSLDPRDTERAVIRMAACAREDCDFMERAKDGATFMEMVEYVWLDASGLDAPPARAVVKRNERLKAEADARGNGASAD